MFALISNIKMWLVVGLITITAASIGTNLYLYNDNKSISKSLADTKLLLDDCQAASELLTKAKDVDDSTLSELFDKNNQLEKDYDALKDKFNQLRCGSVIKKTKPTETRPNEKTDSSTSDIESVRLLLERSACVANSDCKPPESSSSAL